MARPGHKACPYCQEEILATAVKCRFCREWLLPSQKAPLESFFGDLTGKHFGHYQILEQIGDGGMGSVWSARHMGLGRKVAVKILHGHLVSYRDVVKRFLAEARAVVRLGSPHLVEILDLGALPDGRPYFVMEYLEGVALDAWMRQNKPVPLDLLVQIGDQLLQGLQVVHEQGIIHRDLKPSNIMLLPRPDGAPGVHLKLLDFGIAKYIEPEEGEDPLENAITRTGMTVGTPVYMSPEQAGGLKTIDGRSDIYSVGVLLYQAATGTPPFVNDNILHIMEMHRWKQPPPPSTLRPDLPKGLEDWILRCLAKKRDHRFANAEEARKALLAGYGEGARSSSPVDSEKAEATLNASSLATQGEVGQVAGRWEKLRRVAWPRATRWGAGALLVLALLLLGLSSNAPAPQSSAAYLPPPPPAPAPPRESSVTVSGEPDFLPFLSFSPGTAEEKDSSQAADTAGSSGEASPEALREKTRPGKRAARPGGPPGPEALLDPYRKK